MSRPVDRFVESLARRRQPKPFTPTQDEIAVARTAIALAAAAPDADTPREAFVAELRSKLADGDAAVVPVPAHAQAGPSPGRRRFLQAAALTATGAAAGAALDHVVSEEGGGPPVVAAPEITPARGSWQTVASDGALAEGAVVAFDVGGVSGFVRRIGGRLQAVSGVCSHQGCRLDLTDARDRLACPCHGATFALTGTPLTHPFRVDSKLPPLPRLAVRTQDGDVQVYAPNPAEPFTHT